MTEIVSNVYDLIYSSPVPLKEISSSAISVELWRREINQYRANDTLIHFEPVPAIFLKTLIPDIPTVINCIVEEYINRFGFSLEQWLRHHFSTVFNFHRNHPNEILNDFDDFVYDSDGAINFVRTAKRMISSNRLSDDEKFKIACLYSFENDVRIIWPSVSERIDLNEIDFDQCPQLFYWICLLRNELHAVPNQTDDPMDEMMLDKCQSYNWSSLEYFWNRIDSQNRLRKAKDMSMCNKETFTRFFLPKLNDQELDRFVAERGSNLISGLVINSQDRFYVLPTWTYIKNKMNESNFLALVEELVETETNHHIAESASTDEPIELQNWLSTEDETYLCCEVWKNATEKLKQSAIKTVLNHHWLFARETVVPGEFREVRFLLTILLDASFEERNAFWHKNWNVLIEATRGKDLHRIMKLCFKNENDISQFKQTTMAKYENINSYGVKLLEKRCFEELDDFLNFCCSETPARRNLKQRLLQSCFLGENSIMRYSHLNDANLMNEFINEAYDNPDRAAEFKNQLTSSPVTEHCLLESIRFGYFFGLVKFVNTFVSNDQVVMQMKKSFVDILKNHLVAATLWQLKAVDLQSFLVWCLGNDEEVRKFKQSISASEVLRHMMENQSAPSPYGEDEVVVISGVMLRYPPNLNEFLNWYFDTPEEIQEFKREFICVFEIYSPISNR